MRLDRLSRIEKYILEQGSVSLENLSVQFNLSVNTVRRDVIELESRGRILRVRGGAMAKVHPKTSEEIDGRQKKNADAKRRIGELGASLVQDGQTIFIDAGTTTRTIVPYLSSRRNITIVTNSVNVMTEAVKLPNTTLIVLGGEYAAATDSLQSYSAIENMENFNIDITFLGTTGISVDGGFTTATFMDAKFKNSAIRRAKETVVLADRSKYGIRSTSKFAELSEASAIITDGPFPEDVTQYCRNYGIRILTPSDDMEAVGF